MKLTIVQTGEVPESLRARFGPYSPMFSRMFDSAGGGFRYETVVAYGADPLPDPRRLEGILITGSAAGVYDDLPWLEPLRGFIRAAYSARTPMLGICFGHQIMADALGGDVRQSEKGWGLGRHRYDVVARPGFMADAAESLAIACSHQDQVIAPPPTAQVILASSFTPNAGLLYETGRALSFQPHPEFLDDYAQALVDLRRGRAAESVIEAASRSFAQPSDSGTLAKYLRDFYIPQKNESEH